MWVLTYAAAHVRSRMNHYHIRAHFGDLRLDAFLRTLSDGKHRDDGRHADDDAQHGEEGADFVAQDVLDGLFEGLLYHACVPSSPAFGSAIMKFG